MGGVKQEAETLFDPVGCARCNGTGYEGRVGIYELVTADEKLRKLLHDNASEQEIRAHAFRNAPTLADIGYGHVRAGRTSLPEVLRVVQEAEGIS